MKVYLMNGPPRSGKDTAGALLARMLDNSRVLKFAAPLKMATHAMSAMLRGDKKLPGLDGYEGCKDEPSEDFFGRTPRDAYIAVSEDLCKPLFGKTFFGDLMVLKIEELKEQGVENVVITDCGFVMEVEPVIRAVGIENVALMRLEREGCSFDGDSRGYLDLGPNVREFDIHNGGSRAYLRTELAGALEAIEDTNPQEIG